VRAPSRIDRDLYAPATPPYLLAGGPEFESEVVRAFELGYKARPSSTLTGSIATFYNRYEDLRSLEGGPPYVIGNGLNGNGYGIETEANWQPSPPWRFDVGHTFLRLVLRPAPNSTDVSQVAQEGDSPRQQAYVRPSLTLARVWSVDLTGRYVGELPHQQVPAYFAADAHIGWQPSSQVDVGIYARDLFDPRHPEFGTPSRRREIPRSVFGKVTCRF
jgi:iron complex outermembrane receptor protein